MRRTDMITKAAEEKIYQQGDKLRVALGDNIFVVVSLYRDITYVHIRKFVRIAPRKDLVPTKKGITLTPAEWVKLASDTTHQQVTKLQLDSTPPILTSTESKTGPDPNRTETFRSDVKNGGGSWGKCSPKTPETSTDESPFKKLKLDYSWDEAGCWPVNVD